MKPNVKHILDVRFFSPFFKPDKHLFCSNIPTVYESELYSWNKTNIYMVISLDFVFIAWNHKIWKVHKNEQISVWEICFVSSAYFIVKKENRMPVQYVSNFIYNRWQAFSIFVAEYESLPAVEWVILYFSREFRHKVGLKRHETKYKT